ncbi:hypothetical protein TBK1r_48570 [Stieleria magnilauensis]|uniref:Uncharacterized protein n=1 Tax=Stieleria magnilauensis TaxID=2527963 RepID=A0ABX5XVN8_9BACT|nr:hypothetical protein TBK1r_48570 [Planctomycetes bacterium TBK1r]
MDLAHLHLLLNHFPIIGTLFGVGFLAYGVIRSDDRIANAGKVVLVLMALMTIPAYFTGEPAEKVIRAFRGSAKMTSTPTNPQPSRHSLRCWFWAGLRLLPC